MHPSGLVVCLNEPRAFFFHHSPMSPLPRFLFCVPEPCFPAGRGLSGESDALLALEAGADAVVARGGSSKRAVGLRANRPGPLSRLRHRTRAHLRKRLSDCGGRAMSSFSRKQPRTRVHRVRGAPRTPVNAVWRFRLDFRPSFPEKRRIFLPLTTPKPPPALKTRKAISYPLSIQPK